MIHDMMRKIVNNIEYRLSQIYRKNEVLFLLPCVGIFLELVQGLNNNCNCCSVTYSISKRRRTSTKWSSSLICCRYHNVFFNVLVNYLFLNLATIYPKIMVYSLMWSTSSFVYKANALIWATSFPPPLRTIPWQVGCHLFYSASPEDF